MVEQITTYKIHVMIHDDTTIYSNILFETDRERVSSHLNGGRSTWMTTDGKSIRGTILSTHILRLKCKKIQSSNRKRHN